MAVARRYAQRVSSILAILGSGEIAPNMVKVHRELFARLDAIDAVFLDTPFGFQENVPQLSEKIQTYFDTSLQVSMQAASFCGFERSSELERTQFIQKVSAANYVFAGPGSPSYALHQWAPLNLGETLRRTLEQDGIVCFSSAAALTLGSHTAPIYEIYKVGAELAWLPGLDVLSQAGLRAAVIPHYDNAEGGNHDTSRCYIGANRLAQMEALLPDDVAIFGVDEHTAAIIDLDADTISVRGRGNAYWRLGGSERVLANGTTVALSELRNVPRAPRVQDSSEVVVADQSPQALGELIARNGEGALEALSALVSLATSGGPGRVDPAPLIDAVLVARANARATGQYELSDQLRDAILTIGAEVKDGPNGATWHFRDNL